MNTHRSHGKSHGFSNAKYMKKRLERFGYEEQYNFVEKFNPIVSSQEQWTEWTYNMSKTYQDFHLQFDLDNDNTIEKCGRRRIVCAKLRIWIVLHYHGINFGHSIYQRQRNYLMEKHRYYN